ncbi:transforming acidic coiled-coil-containing protein 3 [Chiloscyllium plagiosum]|uniref:transforming acidic coiled-coil-containing protein 3 n=1 Tax=Chiloscyllium plagiosum TaxID=36176 RepID=UPI001CB870B3|nr:transforming acidic coiled-coil-containing protein 3 [Chiloscyllium plagiosum]XP_043566361.1 transforming acidic coiled-coil-containing protein 3 [Chiloscyllium plagiosum]XP_043566454.1 transforming acidic coiled-coil-containing protein 3 [Chiloscyllium plagiosum]XP_043566534.1 transforming acidic coiled-coil-containing protein 3 [Chiloscyllium plagiosum]
MNLGETIAIMNEQCEPLTLEATGKPSILRMSQKENFPPKGSMKLSKVSFQTPVRDPVTRKVLSAHLTNRCGANSFEAGISKKNTENRGNPDVTEAKGHTNSGDTSDSPESDLQAENTDTKQSTADIGLGNEEHTSSKGMYTLDFDMLDVINPFTGVSKILNSPAKKLTGTEPDYLERHAYISSTNDQTLPNNIEQLSKATPCNSNANNGRNESADIPLQVENQSNSMEQDYRMLMSPTLFNFEEDGLEKISPSIRQQKVQVSQLPLKESLNLDHNIDFMTPFQVAGPSLPFQQNLPSLLREDVDLVQPVQLEVEGQEPPPKKLGERIGLAQNERVCSKPEKQSQEATKLDEKNDPDDAFVPKMEYSIEWDKLDDPNFNPFGGGFKICNSPSLTKAPVPHSDLPCKKNPVQNFESTAKEMSEVLRHSESSPSSAELPVDKSDGLSVTDDTVENVELLGKEMEVAQKPMSFAQTINSNEATMPLKQSSKKNTCKVKPMMEVSAIPCEQDPISSPEAENIEMRLPLNFERIIADGRVPSTMTDAEILDGIDFGFSVPGSSTFRNVIESETEEFRPADQIPAFNDPIEIDYLEQFGHSSFHASALRKQSLYLKFDPLLRESPVRHIESNPVLTNGTTNGSSIVNLETRPSRHTESSEEMVVINALVPVPSSINPVSEFPSVTHPTEDAIIEVLKYSQKDMDAAILAVKEEVSHQEAMTLEWKQKFEESFAQCAEMKKIVNEYSEVTFQMMEESGKKSELAKAEMEKLTEEKLQALKELNSIENSFSELFKRFEKQKEAIEGYKKNEESLKKCAQDYLARIKKEEQRYQALKAHAEEKLNQANEEIAQVRNKYKAEVAALQAQLRKEQMKTNSLERSLEEKTKENVELSKICDELISKMEKI